MAGANSVKLLSWSSEDGWAVARFLSSAKMMEHLGGPQTSEQIDSQHQRYLNTGTSGKGQMFKIALGAGTIAIGNIGYWEKHWGGETVYETGWMVLPEFQSKGYAGASLRLLLEILRDDHKYRFLHAFPAVANEPSNALCQKAGFSNRGIIAFEYVGHNLACNDWRLDLGLAGNGSSIGQDGRYE